MGIVCVPSLVLRRRCAWSTMIRRAAPQWWLPPQAAASKYIQDVGTPPHHREANGAGLQDYTKDEK